MNTISKTVFTAALFTVCLLGLHAMTAEPALAFPPCPAIECAPGEYATMEDDGPCAHPWGTCTAYSRSLGRLTYSCYCGCNY